MPPLLAGAVQLTLALSVPAVAFTDVGEPGAVTAMMNVDSFPDAIAEICEYCNTALVDTAVGVVLEVSVLSPNRPLALFPQQYASPRLVTAHAKSQPVEMAE